MQRCTECAYVRWPPAVVCPECLSATAQWHAVITRGQLWSFAVDRRSGTGASSSDGGGPYIVAAVALDEGPFLFGRLMASPEALVIGQPVVMEVGERAGAPVLRFRLAD